MTKLLIIGGSAILCMALSSFAADLPYGADALPYLARRSSTVIIASAPQRAATPNADEAVAPNKLAVALYTVKASAVLKGDVEKGASLNVAIPESVNITNVEQLNDSLLFLDGPLAGEQRAGINIVGDAPIYLLLSGRYGAVSADGSARPDAVREYLGETPANDAPPAKQGQRKRRPPRLNWAQRGTAESKDSFLQRSAILEAAADPTQEKSITLLTNAVRSDAVIPPNKREAIYALQAANSPLALKPLRDVAEDAKQPQPLREAAIKAVGAVPGGRDALLEWRNNADRILSDAARIALDRFDGKRDQPGSKK